MAQYGPIALQKPSDAIELAVGSNYQQLINDAPAGSTFWFAPGIHRGVSIQPKDGDTLLGAPGAVLNGSQLVTSFTQSGSAWVISGQTQEGVRNLTDHTAPDAQRGGFPETVFFDDKPLKPVDSLSKLAAGTFYFDYAADKIYLHDDPTNHKVETGKNTVAINGAADNVTVSNLTIEKYNAPAQLSAVDGGSGEGWTIANNEIRLNYGVGANVGTNGKIIGNYVHDNGEMGLDGGGANIVVQGNELARNGYWSGIDMSWEGGGSKFTGTTDLLVKDNYSHDNAGNGLWTDINNYNTTYDNNLVMGNALAGISHEISYDAVIRNNTVIGNGFNSISGGTPGNPTWLWGAQIQVHNSSNVEVANNYVDYTNAGNGISLIEEDRGSGDRGAYLIRNGNVHDNIIVSKSGDGGNGGESNIDNASYIDGGSVWNANHFYTAGDTFNWGDAANSYAQFEAATTGQNTFAPQAAAPDSPDLSAWIPETSATLLVTAPPVNAPAAGETATVAEETATVANGSAAQSASPIAAPPAREVADNDAGASMDGTVATIGSDSAASQGEGDIADGGAVRNTHKAHGHDTASAHHRADHFSFDMTAIKDFMKQFHAESVSFGHEGAAVWHDAMKGLAARLSHGEAGCHQAHLMADEGQPITVEAIKAEPHLDHILFA